MKMLFIANIARHQYSISFSRSSVEACKQLGWEFHSVANRNVSSPEQIIIDEEKYGITLKHADIRRNPFDIKNFKAYRQIIKLIEKEKYDIIHCNTPIGGFLGRLAGKKCKVKKVIYQAHGFHFYKGAPLLNWLLYYPIECLLARYTDSLITINKEDFHLAQKFKLRNNGQNHYIPGVGMDLASFNDDDIDNDIDVDAIRSSLGLKNTDIICISMGDLIKRKNYINSIKAIAKSYENVHYLICGTGPEETRLKNIVRKLNLEKRVHFLGFRTDIKLLLKISDIYLLSSLQEGLPRSLMEAMASGLPCVVSNIRGNVDLIEDGTGGYLCNPNDADGFAQAINKLVNDSELCEKMGKNNLESIKEFDSSNTIRIMENIYTEVV